MKYLKKITYVLMAVLIAFALVLTIKNDQSSSNSPTGTLLDPDPVKTSITTEHGPTVKCEYPVASGLLSSNSTLFIQSYWDYYEIFANGESVYLHDPASRDGISHMIPVTVTRDVEKITVLFYGGSGKNNTFVNSTQIYIGDAGGIVTMLVRSNLTSFLFSFLAFVMSAAALAFAWFFRKAMAQKYFGGLVWLGVFMFAAALWILTDSKILFMITTRTSAITLISFLSFMWMPLPLLSFNKRLVERSRFIMTVLQYVYTALMAIFVLLYIFMPGYSMQIIYIDHVLLIFVFIVILVTGFSEYRAQPEKPLAKILTGYCLFGIFILSALVCFYLGSFRSYSLLYMAGLLLFLFFLSYGTCIGIYELFQKSKNIFTYERLAYHDMMTGLGNRTAFIEEQRNIRYTHGSFAYILVDINNLKVTNDTHGHKAGDDLIIQTANCLRNAVGDSYNCYRIGGDEFIASLRNVPEFQVKEFIDRLHDEMDKVNQRRSFPLSFAVGYAWTDTLPKNLTLLYEDADAVMYEDKQIIKSREAR